MFDKIKLNVKLVSEKYNVPKTVIYILIGFGILILADKIMGG